MPVRNQQNFMSHSIRFFLVASWFACGLPIRAEDSPVTATIETTLATDGDQIRQLAFDGDPSTSFVSDGNPKPGDHFTLVFDKPVDLQSLTVTTGRADGRDLLDEGAVELSTDGKSFERMTSFTRGAAQLATVGRSTKAVRIATSAELPHALAIRELAIESEPPVTVFLYPVEFVVDTSDAPEMKEWIDNAAATCQRAYPMMNEELKAEGYKPPRLITMTLKSEYRGVAATSENRIVGSVKFFKEHPDDIGAMIHETVHVVQSYRGRRNPGWLVEGVADYVRFFKYEPGNLGPINARRAHYNGSYRVSAAFLAFLVERYDKDIVRQLNQLMRAGEYRDETFKVLTGKTLDELDDEWRATLAG
jgi:hypothetical protein